MKLLARLLPLSMFAPVLAFAQTPGNFNDITDFLGGVTTFINQTLVPLVFALAFLVFIWGVAQYFILGGEDEDKQEKGKSLMLYGIIGFVVMVSIWGIVNLLSRSFGLQSEEIEIIPNTPDQQR